MPRPPDVPLTAVQFEIMQVVWNAPDGATVAEIWDAISKGRDVARTTILNLVRRLDRRGWLKRANREGTYRYVATIDRNTATSTAAEKFVDEFFDGSAAELVMSLLGSKRMSKSEMDDLRQVLERARSRKPERP